MRIRIKAKPPGANPQPEGAIARVNGCLASWSDIELEANGGLVPLTEVKSIEFRASDDDPTSPITARIELYIDELDIECEGD